MSEDYNPESYWDNVAQHISKRDKLNLIAGDDEPYYRYKRKLFLKLLNTIDFQDKSVLEVGSGPGGNLNYLATRNCREIAGVDISSKMIDLSIKLLKNKNIQINKIDGTDMPFENNRFDIVFTSTVLQHNTNEAQLRALIKNICRVSKNEIILFERIEKKEKGHQSNLGRPVEYYSALLKDQGFILIDKKFLPIQASYYICGSIRKIFSKKERGEGEPVGKIPYLLEIIALPFTKVFDKIIPSNRDLGMLRFKKNPEYQMV